MPNKYHARKTVIDGITFDSIAESNRYCQLRLLEQAGTITGLQVHKPFVVWDHGKEKIKYIADFTYQENGKTVCEDTKGVVTQVFRIKSKLFRARYPDIELRVIGA